MEPRRQIPSATQSAHQISTRFTASRTTRHRRKVRFPWSHYRFHGRVQRDIGWESYSTAHYQPLREEEQEIRLLCYSGLTADSNTICCTLEHAKLTDKPDFVALSYAWGDPKSTKAVIVNGIKIQVTETLEMALQHLIRIGISDNNIRLSADSICINQQDEKEKTWQVQLMREIYHQAEFVVAWLGPGDRDSDEALDQLARIGAKILRLENGTLNFMGTNGEYPLYLWDDESEPELVTKLLQRSYFERVWVLQEIAVSKNFVFVCGTASVPGLIAHLAITLFLMWKGERFGQLANANTPLMEALIPTGVIVHLGLRNPQPKTLTDLLQYVFSPRSPPSHGLQATDPRDRVYALLGMASDSKQLGVRPDYSVDCSTVYTHTARKLLETRNLGILSFCQEPKKQSNLPSWVPDWSYLDHNELNGVGINEDLSNYSASRGYCSDQEVELDPNDPNLISLLGCRFDAVDGLGRSVEQWSGYWGFDHGEITVAEAQLHYGLAFLSNLRIMVRIYGKLTYAKKDLEDAIFQTATAGKDLNALISSNRAQRPFRDIMREFCDGDPSNLQDKAVYGGAIMAIANGRRPFVTKNGYLGVGPHHMEPDDQAVIFLGADVPFILRPLANNQWRLIGEAYIHGIMRGELADHGLQIERFTLR